MDQYPNGRRVSPRRKSMPAFMLETNKENTSPSSKSNGAPGMDDMTLPIMKSSRPSLIPGRSILKATNYDDNNTITGVFNFSATNAFAKRKKSMNRRVSFAPEAAVRRFDPERESSSPAAKEPRRKSILKKTAFTSPPKMAKSPPSQPSQSPKKSAKIASPPKKAASPAKKQTPEKKSTPRKSPTPKRLPPQLASPSPASRTRSKSPIVDEESDMDISDASVSPTKRAAPKEDDMLISFDSPEAKPPVRKLYQETEDKEKRLSFPSIFNTKLAKPQGAGEMPDGDQELVGGRGDDDGDGDADEQTMEFTTIQQPLTAGKANENADNDEDDEVSMDMTTVGGPPSSMEHEADDEDGEDVSMDMTTINEPGQLGGIQEESEGEVSMDITRTLGSSNANNDEEGDEQTMDITRSFGGIQGGNDDDDDDAETSMEVTRAIGQIRPGDVGADDEEATMDVTRSYGKIAQQNGNDEMEMTQAIGKISLEERRRSLVGNGAGEGEEEGTDVTQAMGDIQQLKRPFSPRKNTSPSPKRQKPSTPQKQQIPDASAVFQRTPSQVLREGIMSLTPRRSARRSLKESPHSSNQNKPLQIQMDLVSHTPLRSAKTWDYPNPAPSPVKSQMIQHLAQTIEEDEYENVSLTSFLNTVNIDFMDDFLTSTRGHSSFGLTSETTSEPKFVDYVVAGQRIAVFGVYDFSIREMRNNVRTAKGVFEQFEEDTMDENPLLFKEYFDASPDTKQIMNGQFKLMKTYAREQAKNVWYGWRTNLIQNVYKVLEKNMNSLKDDRTLVDSRKDAILAEHSDISSKHSEMKRKLEAMRKRQKELENCDRDALTKAQDKLASSKKALNAVKVELEEQTQGVRAVRESVESLLQQKRKLQDEIQAAEKIQQEHRRIGAEEITELRNRFHMVQTCCGISNPRLRDNQLEFAIDRELQVIVDLEKQSTDVKIQSQDVCLNFFKPMLAQNSLKVIKQRWQRAKRISHDLKVFSIQHMANVYVEKGQLVVKVRLHLKSSKVHIKVRMDMSTLESYPTIQGQVSMSNVYGNECELDNTCSKLESRLQSQGMIGVSQECTKLIL